MLWFALLVASTLLAAGEWPSQRHDLDNSGAVSGPTQARTVHLHFRWKFEAASRITSTPVVVGGLVFAGTWAGDVVVLDAETGALRWRRSLGANPDEAYGGPRGVIGSVAVSRGRAYAVSGSCTAAAFEAASGKALWRRSICTTRLNDDTYASPVVAGGLALFGIDQIQDRPTDRGRVVALEAATGRTRWALYPQRYRGSGTGISATPAIDSQRGIAYVATGNPTPVDAPPPGDDPWSDSLLAVDLSSGRIVWAYGPVHPHDTRDDDFFASPNRFTVGEGARRRTCIGDGNKDGSYYVVDASNGRERWRQALLPEAASATIVGTAAVGRETVFVPVYVNDGFGALVALRAADGVAVWRRRTAGLYEAPLLWGGVVFVAEARGTLRAFASADGVDLGTWDLGGKATGRGPSLAGDTLYVAAGTRLFAFRVTTR